MGGDVRERFDDDVDDDDNTSPGTCVCLACLATARVRAALRDACVTRIEVVETPATGTFDVYLQRKVGEFQVNARGTGATTEEAVDKALELLEQEVAARMREAGGP